ncbi:two-component system sporulation sensor kinase B [Bacillus mesophilus]|nr:two-component system sporulation sensor kinase B [Bacillus mesophilus]
MTFPIRLELGAIYDLRYIPFIIASLYGGFKTAIPLYIILNVYRFIIGGEGVFLSFLFSTVILLLVPVWSKKFLTQLSDRRVIIAALASFGTMVLYLINLSMFYGSLDKNYWLITANVLTIHVTGTIVITILIEKIIMNVKNRERYMESERLNLISELSASVSHEIRNPLTVTSGFLQLLNESKTINKEEKQYITYSLEELKRAEKIVSDFLSFAKPQAENMVFSNLKEEIDYVNNVMKPYANYHQVDLECQFSNSLYIKYDQNQLRQCLINLYKNGIEAMKVNGGTLSIHVSEQKHEIKINIADNGIGMTEEEISRVGKPYYSTKEEGTGLGMVMVYTTVNKLKGKIEVKSEKEKGTSFTITIPA